MFYEIKAKEKEIRWDFKWNSRFVDSNIKRFINKGHTEAPIEVEIYGHIKNPKISLYVEGDLFQEVPLFVEIMENEKLLYGTKENNFYIKRQKTDKTTEDLFNLDVIKFENDNVIRIPKNKSCRLKLMADNKIKKAIIKIFTYYKIVQEEKNEKSLYVDI